MTSRTKFPPHPLLPVDCDLTALFSPLLNLSIPLIHRLILPSMSIVRRPPRWGTLRSRPRTTSLGWKIVFSSIPGSVPFLTRISRAALLVLMIPRALRFVARLMQSFGALLLTPLSRVQYRRVATDSLIIVRVGEETPLNELMDDICTIDIQ